MLTSRLIYGFLCLTITLTFPQLLAAQPSRVVITTFDQAAPRLNVSERVMREIYKKLNIEMQLDRHPGNRALSLANGGKVDGALIRTAVIENTATNLVRIPVPIANIRYMAYTKKANGFTIKNWGSLKPYSIGMIRGIKLIEDRSHLFDSTLISTPESLFKMLYLERVDVAVFTELDGLFTLKKINLHNDIIKLSPPLEVVPVYHYIHRKNSALIEQLSSLMQTMETSGELKLLIKASENQVIDTMP